MRIEKRTGAAKTFEPILAMFLVDTSVIPMLAFPAPAAFAPASGFNFSGWYSSSTTASVSSSSSSSSSTQTDEVHYRWITSILTWQVEQLVGYSVMTEVDILMISGLLLLLLTDMCPNLMICDRWHKTDYGEHVHVRLQSSLPCSDRAPLCRECPLFPGNRNTQAQWLRVYDRDVLHHQRGTTLCLVSTIPLPFFRSVATVAVARENGNAGNVFPYT